MDKAQHGTGARESTSRSGDCKIERLEQVAGLPSKPAHPEDSGRLGFLVLEGKAARTR